MVVLAGDIMGVTALKREGDSILVVNPNAVCPRPISLQSLKPIARRCAEIPEDFCGVEHVEFPPDSRPQLLWKPTCFSSIPSVEYVRRRVIPEGSDHA